jgi:hypothetical protein
VRVGRVAARNAVDEFDAAVDVEFEEDVLEMRGDGVRRDEELLGDGSIRQSLDDQPGDVAFGG